MHKKRKILLLLLVMAALLPLPERAWAESGAPANQNLEKFFRNLQTGKQQTVVAYGTSVTKYGYWVTAMQEWFEKEYPGKVTVINSGGPGQNSNWGLAAVQAQVLDHHPDLVLIEFAINDAHVRFKIPVEQAKSNLEKMIASIRAQNPQTAIVLQTMNALWDNEKGFGKGDSDRPKLNDFNENYRKVAAEQSLPLVDNYPMWLEMKQKDYARFQSVVPDGTHPNKFGSLAVTWPNLQQVLELARKDAKQKP
jgi:lysophospholipase L1-like esterase